MEYQPVEYYDPVEGEAAETELGEALWKGFDLLEKDGYFVGHNWTCCDSCGWAEVPNECDLVVFYHMQASERANETGVMYIAWSGDANHICSRLREAGLSVSHDGRSTSKIVAQLPQLTH